jgi:2-haloacid dehalogenase
MIRDVVFDLGKVLIDWDPRHLLTAHVDDATADALVTTLDIDEAQRQLDLGVPVADVHDRWRAAHPEHLELVDRYFGEWERTVAGAIDPVVGLLSEVRSAGVGLYALSNFSAELFTRVRPRFRWLDWFDGLVISGAEGVIKPDPRIYRLLVDRYGLRPEWTVFIDDRPENVAGADAVGIVGIEFRSIDTLREDLRSVGVL